MLGAVAPLKTIVSGNFRAVSPRSNNRELHGMTNTINPRRFDIALSFPGEHCVFVEQVAAHLATTFSEDRVLYDKYQDAEFARLDLNVYLPNLYRARLFGLRNEEAETYPWESPEADLAAAEKLINACGYHRRDEELADARRVILE